MIDEQDIKRRLSKARLDNNSADIARYSEMLKKKNTNASAIETASVRSAEEKSEQNTKRTEAENLAHIAKSCAIVAWVALTAFICWGISAISTSIAVARQTAQYSYQVSDAVTNATVSGLAVFAVAGTISLFVIAILRG